MKNKVIIGLGNPEPNRQNTRHNVGFHIIDRLAKDLNYTFIDDCLGLISLNDIILFKPMTGMNKSGNAVKLLVDKYKPSSILLVYDDLSLNEGVIKFKHGGSSGGHNGVKSINYSCDKLKIGIGPDPGGDMRLQYVLEPYTFPDYSLQPLMDYINKELSYCQGKYNK